MRWHELDSDMSHLWDEMLAEFRALGGTADNICLKDGRFGRGLFPRDPPKPIKVHIPESLLIDVEHLEFENYNLRVGPKSPAGAREKVFLERYEREFSWGVGREHTEAILKMFQGAPAGLREILEAPPLSVGWWLADPNPKSIAERYFGSRAIEYHGRRVIMPIVELANHGEATQYEIGNGIGLSGRFGDEILVRYELACDSLNIFSDWGFASPEDAAFSLPMRLEKSGIGIHRETVKSEPGRPPLFPRVSVAGGRITFPHLLLGHKKYPRLARGIFYRIMRDAGRKDVEETFDMIQHVNRMQFHKLEAASEDAPPTLGRLLREVARHQLEAMSHNIGTREI